MCPGFFSQNVQKYSCWLWALLNQFNSPFQWKKKDTDPTSRAMQMQNQFGIFCMTRTKRYARERKWKQRSRGNNIRPWTICLLSNSFKWRIMRKEKLLRDFLSAHFRRSTRYSVDRNLFVILYHVCFCDLFYVYVCVYYYFFYYIFQIIEEFVYFEIFHLILLHFFKKEFFCIDRL